MDVGRGDTIERFLVERRSSDPEGYLGIMFRWSIGRCEVVRIDHVLPMQQMIEFMFRNMRMLNLRFATCLGESANILSHFVDITSIV